MLKAKVAGSWVLSQINRRWEFRPHISLAARPRVGNIVPRASASSSADNHTPPTRLRGGLNGCLAESQRPIQVFLVASPSPATSQMQSPFPTHSPPDLPAPRAALAKSPSLTGALQTWQRFNYKETMVSGYRSSRGSSERRVLRGWERPVFSFSEATRGHSLSRSAAIIRNLALRHHLWAKKMERREQTSQVPSCGACSSGSH